MGEKYLLGVDVGTSSIKVAIIDEKGKLKGITSGVYNLIQEAPGWQQIDADDMWRACLECIGRLKLEQKIDLGKIAGIGISCLCPGLTAFDREGQVLVNPIIYSDQRSVEEAEEIRQKVGEECMFGITANNVMAGAMSGTSMLWVKKHLPEIYEKIYCFGHINTLVAVRMTGNFAIDYSNASYTSLFETGGGYRWSDELCGKIGIPKEKLPPLIKSHEVVGELIAEDLIGVGIPKGIPVVIGGGDTACASLATGVIRSGDVCESVGTTNVLTVCVTEPRFDKGFINRCHVVEDAWIYQGALSHTGASLRWMRDEFCQDLKMAAEAFHDNVYDLMTGMADIHSIPGAGGIVFLPYMLGERSPVWDPYARGVFFGVSLDSHKDDFIRAVLEGAAYGLRQLCELAEQVTGRPIREFCAIGGGAKNTVWSQIKADVTGKDIITLDVNDMAPVGAALLAGIGIGCFRDAYEASDSIEKTVYRRFISRRDNDEVYARRYDTYKKLYPQLKDLYRSN
ncbi:MAG: sugar kinase, partial [Lachnospiraceae bacterium]|nr:sugar kinase [Lachnospiraceae bacterium]